MKLLILRDEVPVSTPLDDQFKVLAWFHRHTSSSMDHAIKHEGYSVIELDPIREKLVALPDLYKTDGTKGDRDCVKLFLPEGAATWVVWEYNYADDLAFGWVTLGFGPASDEMGYVNIQKLLKLRGPLLGLPVEVDQHVHKAFAAIESVGGIIPEGIK